jgi:hypothetical protein
MEDYKSLSLRLLQTTLLNLNAVVHNRTASVLSSIRFISSCIVMQN